MHAGRVAARLAGRPCAARHTCARHTHGTAYACMQPLKRLTWPPKAAAKRAVEPFCVRADREAGGGEQTGKRAKGQLPARGVLTASSHYYGIPTRPSPLPQHKRVGGLVGASPCGRRRPRRSGPHPMPPPHAIKWGKGSGPPGVSPPPTCPQQPIACAGHAPGVPTLRDVSTSAPLFSSSRTTSVCACVAATRGGVEGSGHERAARTHDGAARTGAVPVLACALQAGACSYPPSRSLTCPILAAMSSGVTPTCGTVARMHARLGG
jgi:hypothetical protein